MTQFNEEYEDFIGKSLQGLTTNSKLIKELRAKRDFGLNKYGEISFQFSLENAMKVDTIQHAKEELIDYLNYTLHEIFKNSRIGDFERVNEARVRFKKAVELFLDTD